MTRSEPGGYTRTQRGIFHWLLILAGIAIAVPAVVISDENPLVLVALLVPALFLLISACFARLTVRDDGDALEIAFGPLELFRRRVPYADIETATRDRSILLEGWGIHYIPGRGGWIWNIHGFDCVRLSLRGGKLLRVGTGDPDGLAAFVQSRLPG